MAELSKMTGIQVSEFLNQVHIGLREVNRILRQRYPEALQLKNAIFTFSTATENSASAGAKLILGYERSSTKTYTSATSITLTYDEIQLLRPRYAKFDYKESVFNLSMEFAGYILRSIADYVIIARTNPDIPITAFDISESFSVQKSNSGSLGFKFFDLVDVSANIKRSKTVTHNFKITFEATKSKSKSKNKARTV